VVEVAQNKRKNSLKFRFPRTHIHYNILLHYIYTYKLTKLQLWWVLVPNSIYNIHITVFNISNNLPISSVVALTVVTRSMCIGYTYSSSDVAETFFFRGGRGMLNLANSHLHLKTNFLNNCNKLKTKI